MTRRLAADSVDGPNSIPGCDKCFYGTLHNNNNNNLFRIFSYVTIIIIAQFHIEELCLHRSNHPRSIVFLTQKKLNWFVIEVTNSLVMHTSLLFSDRNQQFLQCDHGGRTLIAIIVHYTGLRYAPVHQFHSYLIRTSLFFIFLTIL